MAVVKKEISKPKKVRKAKTVKEKIPIAAEITRPSPLPKLSRRNLLIAIIALVLLVLIFYKRNLIIAAMVNNQPVTSLELQQRLNKLYKNQVLNQIVNEKIIEQEAAKKGIFVTPKQINDKIAETENQYGGTETFESLLAQQGLSREEFARQIKYQLIVEQLYKEETNPTEDEIQKYIEANKDDPEATDAAKFKQTAQNALKQQKLGQVFNQKFQELKQSAKVQIF